MSGNLTRILNNQIYNATIVGYQKIQPYSITGSLFGNSLTIGTDLTITGNLTVTGNSQITTVASTNTFINDPLIVLNNAFTGTNSYDLGFVFNRGTLVNQAFIWNETNKEFRLISTTESGSTQGSINQSTFANLTLGNLSTVYSANVGSMTVTGNLTANNLTLTGSIESTGSTTFYLANSGATTVFEYGAAVNLSAGGGSGTANIAFGNVNFPNATTFYAQQPTVAVFNTPTTVNAFTGASSALQIGNQSGTLTLNPGTVVGAATTQNLYNTVATTVSLANIANVIIGSGTLGSNIQIAPQLVNFLNASNITVGTTTLALANVTATTVQAFGSASTLNLAGPTGTTTIRNSLVVAGGFGLSGILYANSTAYTTGVGAASSGALVVAGGATIGGNLYVGAGIQNTAIGNVTPNSGVFSYVLAGNVQASFIGNTGSTGQFNTVNAGAVNTPTVGNVGSFLQGANLTITAQTGAPSTIIASSTSNVLIQNAAASTTTTTGALQVSGGVGVGGQVTAATLVATGNVWGGLAQFASINATPVGNATASTGAFTTLSAANNLWANASIATTTQGTGAIVVPNGGISVAGAANIALTTTIGGATQINNTLGVGGAVTLTLGTNATGTTSGGTFTVTGGAAFSQDVWIGGNLYVANIIGQQTTILSISDPLLYLNANNMSSYNYDIGLYSHFIGTGLGTPNPTKYQHTGMIRNDADQTWTFFSNVAADPTSGQITFDGFTVYDPIKAGNIALVNGNPAISSTSGALQVQGGAGITGNLYVGSGIQNTKIGNVTPESGAFTALTATNVSAVTIGNTGALLTGSTVAVGNIAAVTIGNSGATVNADTINSYITKGVTIGNTGALLTGSTVAVGNISAVTIGNTGATVNADTINGYIVKAVTIGNTGALLTGGTAAIGNISAGAVNAPVIGNTATFVTGSTAAFGNIAAAVIGNTSAFITGSTSVIGNISAGTVNAPVIGNTATFVTGSTAAFGNITAGNIGNVGAVVTAGTINTNTINAGAVNSPVVGNTASFHTGSTAAFGNISAVNFGNAGATVTASTIQAGNISVTTTGNIYIANTGVSTSPTTGVLTVAGGVGINSNINVNNGATFNYAQSTSSASIVTIRGASDSALFVATPGANGYDGVVIGGQGNALPQGGVSLKVGGTGAMMVPVGGSGQTPGLTGNVDVLGMIRYDTGLQSLAYYNGSVWASIGGAFTVIQDAQYNGDGANVAYTLSSFGNANVTTNSTLVSINGVIQIPGSAYSVNFNSGTSTLTFTEAPAVGDLIDVRYYTASASVTNINNGYLAFDVNSTNYANISTGNTISLSTPRITVDNDGHVGLVNGSKLTYNQGNLNIAANNVSYIVDTFYQTAFTSAKYIVQAKNSNGGTGNVETHEAMVITDGAGTAHITVYGTINMGYSMGALGVTIAGGNVNLTYTSVTSAGVNANVKVYSNYIV